MLLCITQVTFTIICSKLKPTQVVQLLNNMYTLFDFLCDQNAVYKVETIGDAYLIVAGCPNKAANHALKICDMAFDMMDGIKILKVPGSGDDIHMRIGIHSGPVVAGVVGLKMPRYCLFGTNVGLTEKFESNSKPDQIHISEKTIELISSQYKLEERHDEGLKMKIGGHRSYFLTTKENRKPLQEAVIKALLPTDKEGPKLSKSKEKKEEKKAPEKKEDSKKKEEPKPAAKPAANPGAAAETVEPSPAAQKSSSSPSSGDPAESSAPVPADSGPPPSAPTASPPASEDQDGDDAAEEEEEQEQEAGAEEPEEVEKEEEEGPLVETVNQQQCCGGLKKSGVCTVI